jgi:hypothetical protein
MRAFGKALAEWALAHEVDTDVAGGSLVARWLDEVKRPLSDPPPRASGQFRQPSIPAPPPLPDLLPSGQLQPPSTPVPMGDTPMPPVPMGDTPMSPVPMGDTPAPPAPLPLAYSPARRRPRRGRAAAVLGVLALAAAGLLVARPRLLGSLRHRILAAVAPLATGSPAATAGSSGEARNAPSASSEAATASAPREAPPETSTSSAAPSVAAPTAWNACVLSQFAPHAFESTEPIDQKVVCSETDPRKGALAIRSRLVLANGGRPTDAMREWALLSWYEMAAFAVVRARCCAAPPPVKLPPPVGVCDALDHALDALGAAASGQGDVEPAIVRLRRALLCAALNGGDAGYSYKGKPPDGSESALLKTIERRPSSGR